jgi:hypothetical protein
VLRSHHAERRRPGLAACRRRPAVRAGGYGPWSRRSRRAARRGQGHRCGVRDGAPARAVPRGSPNRRAGALLPSSVRVGCGTGTRNTRTPPHAAPCGERRERSATGSGQGLEVGCLDASYLRTSYSMSVLVRSLRKQCILLSWQARRQRLSLGRDGQDHPDRDSASGRVWLSHS